MNPIADFRTPESLPEGALEWEELPSLGNIALRRHLPRDSYRIAAEFVEEAQARRRSLPPAAPAWVATMPAILDPLRPSGPLAETHIEGLAAREIVEPDLFRHFFGAESR